MGLVSSKNTSCLLLFGPTRAGKSSFINTLAGENLAAIGNYSNESTTSTVNSYHINVQAHFLLNFFCVDVPGINDSKLRMTNAELEKRIEEKLLSSTTFDSLSCILVFESLASEPTQLRKTLCTLEGMLGKNYQKSVVVVLTKEDAIRGKKELEGAKKTAEGICKDFGMPYIYWRNNHQDFTVDEGVFRQQVRELKSKICSASEYQMKRVKDVHDKIEERARMLEFSTPKKKRFQQVEVVSKEFQPYIVPVQKSRTSYRVIPKRNHGIKKLFCGKWKEVVEAYTEYYTENETRYKEVEVKRFETKQVEIPFGPDHFIKLARDEILEELRNQYSQSRTLVA